MTVTFFFYDPWIYIISLSGMRNIKKKYWKLLALLNFGKIVIANVIIRISKISLINKTKPLTYFLLQLDDLRNVFYFLLYKNNS